MIFSIIIGVDIRLEKVPYGWWVRMGEGCECKIEINTLILKKKVSVSSIHPRVCSFQKDVELKMKMQVIPQTIIGIGA